MSLQNWLPGPGLQAIAEGAIGAALLAIALALVFIINPRRRLRYRWLGYLFAPLLVASALTHFEAMNPTSGGVGVAIKIAAALIAVATAVALWVLAPRVLATPSAAQLADLNSQLTAAVDAHTAELSASNDRLTHATAQRSLAQHALARSEEQYRVSFEAATVGKVQSDPETGVVIRANPAFAAMLGYEPGEILGRDGWELIWPEDRAADRLEFARVTSGEIPAYVREKRFLRKDGAAVWARVSANIVKFPQSGQPDLTIAVVEDIDERRRAQAALEGTRRDLEAVVNERTEALLQRDLLLREVYHRVKNNLQVIDSILVMQARQLSDPAAKQALASLRGRVYALGLVHHQLMGSSDLQTFDVAPFLEELSRNLVDGAARQGIGLTVTAAPMDVGLDFAIPLGLLVTELVSNSLKHAFPGGKGSVEVMLSLSDNGDVDLVVSDDGVGCDVTKRAIKPSGNLGESIIEGLVHQLKATMIVNSHNGTRHQIHMARAA